jgi:Family of unknown function (DUF1028)
MRRILAIAGLIALVFATDRSRAQTTHAETPGTFSILGYDPDTGEIGGAVQSRVFSAGNGVLWAEAVLVPPRRRRLSTSATGRRRSSC